MNEIKEIPGHALYYCDSLGSIYSSRLGKNLYKIKVKIKENGYAHFCTYDGGKQKWLYVHRAVMMTFIGASDMEVNHKNGIKTDNSIDNLEYCTHAENNRHAFRTGLNYPPLKGKHGFENVLAHEICFEMFGERKIVYGCIEFGIATGMNGECLLAKLKKIGTHRGVTLIYTKKRTKK